MSRQSTKGEGVEAIGQCDILYIGHDVSKLAAASAMFRTMGSRFIGVFDDELLYTDAPAGAPDVVIFCNSVSQRSRNALWHYLYAAHPAVPIFVMEGSGAAPETCRIERMVHAML
jgi:hypothetical protein